MAQAGATELSSERVEKELLVDYATIFMRRRHFEQMRPALTKSGFLMKKLLIKIFIFLFFSTQQEKPHEVAEKKYEKSVEREADLDEHSAEKQAEMKRRLEEHLRIQEELKKLKEMERRRREKEEELLREHEDEERRKREEERAKRMMEDEEKKKLTAPKEVLHTVKNDATLKDDRMEAEDKKDDKKDDKKEDKKEDKKDDKKDDKSDDKQTDYYDIDLNGRDEVCTRPTKNYFNDDDGEGESEGGYEDKKHRNKRKKMRKKLNDTKKKFQNFKNRALDSFPTMESIKSRVKDLLPSRAADDLDDETRGGDSKQQREQKIFIEYRSKYPDIGGEFFSDSELIESRRSIVRCSKEYDDRQNDMYEEMDETEDRVEMLCSPILGPLRPPRKTDYNLQSPQQQQQLKLYASNKSEPNLSEKTSVKKPKRGPPKRPPLPVVVTSERSSVDNKCLDAPPPECNDLKNDVVPANVFYRMVVKKWQQNNEKRMNLISQSSPNLRSFKPQYDNLSISSKLSHPPMRPPLPLRRLSHHKNDMIAPTPRMRKTNRSVVTLDYDHYEFIDDDDDLISNRYKSVSSFLSAKSLPPTPLPPPRLRKSQLSLNKSSTVSTKSVIESTRRFNLDYLNKSSDKADLATDGLYWRPFSWKTGRCRSLTELYLNKRTSDLENSLRYRLITQYCVPRRPPLPSLPSAKPRVEEPLYSYIDRRNEKPITKAEPTHFNANQIIQNRPLPLPPIPPRDRSSLQKRSASPYRVYRYNIDNIGVNGGPFIRAKTPTKSVQMKDASVSTTEDDLLNQSKLWFSEKQVQTSFDRDRVEDNRKLTTDDDDDDLTPRASECGGKNCDVNSKAADDVKSDPKDETSSKLDYQDAPEYDTDLDNFTDLDSLSTDITSNAFQSIIDDQNVATNEAQKTPSLSSGGSTDRPDDINNMNDDNMMLFGNAMDDDDDDDFVNSMRRSTQREIRECIERKSRTSSVDHLNQF